MESWIDQFIGAWNAHDANAITSFMTEDAEYLHSGGSERLVLRGLDAIRSWIDSLNSEWSSDYTLEKTFSVLTEHAFAIEYSERGTADLGDNAPGRRFSLHSVFIGEMRDRKISRITDYADMLAYTQQIEGTSTSDESQSG